MNLRKSKKIITTTEDRRFELRTSKVEIQYFPAKKGCKWRLFTGHSWESSHLSTQLLSNHRWLHPNTLVVWFHRHSFVLEASCYENHNPNYNLTPPKTFLAQLRLPTFLLHVCPNLLQLWTSQHVFAGHKVREKPSNRLTSKPSHFVSTRLWQREATVLNIFETGGQIWKASAESDSLT